MRITFPRLTRDRWRWFLVGLVLVLTVTCIGQLLYPRDRIVPFTTVDSVPVGGWVQKDATWELDRRVAEQAITITIAGTNQAYHTPKASEMGLRTSNEQRVTAAGYPLWARLIPSSLLWYHLVIPPTAPQYIRNDAQLVEFVKTTLGDCKLAPKDAGIIFKDNSLQLVPASPGGTCDRGQVLSKLRQVKPTISQPATASIAVRIEQPGVSDSVARQLISSVEERTKNGVTLKVNNEAKVIPQSELLPWLRFTPKDEKLTVSIDSKTSDDYFAKHITSLVTAPAGVTVATTRDFTEVSRKNGKSGRTLSNSATRESLRNVVEGKETEAEAVVQTVKPKVSYKRSYTKSSTGIAAMLAHYDQDNPGVFGVSFVELDGAKRAAHNQDRVFTTASTYKLFVAFSTLKQVDSGKYKWSDKIVGGRTLATCFDDMIVKSDNPCAEALLEKVGRTKLDGDLRSIGLRQSTFRAASNQTTAAELTTFLTKLQNNDLPLKSSSRDRLLTAMKRQQFRQGIPAGANGAVADKVGFLNGLLHDAAIVYSPKGTYVLVILSDKSTWASIANITRKIEALR